MGTVIKQTGKHQQKIHGQTNKSGRSRNFRLLPVTHLTKRAECGAITQKVYNLTVDFNGNRYIMYRRVRVKCRILPPPAGAETGARTGKGSRLTASAEYDPRGNGERTMKGKCKQTVCLILTVVLVATLCGGLFACSEKAEPTVISIGTTEQTAVVLAPLVDRFNEMNGEGSRAILHIYRTEEIKNYYLSHGMEDCDIYTFDYAVSANRYSDQLASLDRNVYTNRYMVSIINSLRASDGHLYVIPSDGFYYTQSYNTDLLAQYGLEVPTTIGDLKILASRLRTIALEDGCSTSASLGGDDSVLFALMSVAYPLFLSTVRGAEALRGLADGSLSFTDPAYEDDWREIFVNLQVLYNNDFYTLDDLDRTTAEGLDRFNAGKAFAMQNSARVDLSPEMNVAYAPFVGNEGRDACFGSVPALYLAASGKISTAGTGKYAAVSAFFDLFSTSEGQALLHTGETQYVSYLKNSTNTMLPVISNLQSDAVNGSFFVVDSFFNLFGLCVEEICDFLSSRTNLATMMRDVDKKLEEEKHSVESSLTVIDMTLPFDEERSWQEPSELGAYYAGALASVNFVDAAVLPSTALRCSLLSGVLTASMLDTVFSDVSLVYAEVTVADLLRVHAWIQCDCYPLLSGVRIEGDTVLREGGRRLSADERVYILMPDAAREVLGADAVIGQTVSSQTLLRTYYSHLSLR